MTRPFRDGAVWAWLLGGALALIAILYLLGCGGASQEAKAADAARCLEEGVGEMLTSRSCVDALQSLQRVIRRSPECAVVLTPQGSELTALTLGAVTLVCGDWTPPGDGGG